jgi:hypothetical protein
VSGGFSCVAWDVGPTPVSFAFSAVTDPPDRWPGEVSLQIEAISFSRDEPMVLEIPGANYRSEDLMRPQTGDEVCFRLYDSGVVLDRFYQYGRGLNFFVLTPKDRSPQVVFDAVGTNVARKDRRQTK